MSEQPAAIVFRDVVKEYKLGKSQYPTLKEWALNVFSRHRRPLFRALDGVSFDVRPGEVLGFIGENGSGKSTLLKLIAGITAPSSGEVSVHGRVSSLLEIGTGFHPEMTGRENIYLSGALLDIPQQVIEDSFDEIVDFADLREFIDTPVKHYSSGMYMRLGFSIATKVDPDILLIDEVLAVGDDIFQKKCKDVILQLGQRGKTLIFVSHDLNSVSEICSRCLLLDHGKIVAEGPPREAIQAYEKRIFDRKFASTGYSQPWFTRAGTMEARIESVKILDQDGKPSQHFSISDSLTVEVEYQSRRRIENAGFGISISQDEFVVFGTTTYQCQVKVPPLEEGKGSFRLVLPELDLLPGIYFITANIFPTDNFEVFLTQKFHEQIFDLHCRLYPFQVEGETPFNQLEGVSCMKHKWEVPGADKMVIQPPLKDIPSDSME